MKLEFVLIVGVVFFCCWCAYVVIKMSNTLSSPDSLSVPQQSVNLASNVRSYDGRMKDLMNRARGRVSNYSKNNEEPTRNRNINQDQNQNSNYEQRLGAANSPPYSYINPVYQNFSMKNRKFSHNFQPTNNDNFQASNGPNLTLTDNQEPSLQQPHLMQQTTARHWPQSNLPTNPYFPTQLNQRNFPQQLNNVSGQNNLNGRSSTEQRIQQYEESREPEGSENDNETENSDEATEQQPSEIHGNEENQNKDSQDNDEGEDRSSNDDPDETTEIEDVAGGKAFGEDEWEATERDADGKPILTYHRHTINGKPIEKSRNNKTSVVKTASSSSNRAKYRDKNKISEIRKSPKEIEEEAKFSQIVDEIDESTKNKENEPEEDEPADKNMPDQQIDRIDKGNIFINTSDELRNSKNNPDRVSARESQLNNKILLPYHSDSSKVYKNPYFEQDMRRKKGDKNQYDHKLREFVKTKLWRDDSGGGNEKTLH